MITNPSAGGIPRNTRRMTMIELFYVTTVVKEYHSPKGGSYEDVCFIWFRSDPAEAEVRAYHELIRDYQPHDQSECNTKNYIDELFTLDEAKAVKDFLDRTYGDWGPHTIEQQELPIPNSGVRMGALADMARCNWRDSGVVYMLDKDPDYSLPFRVWGYCDTAISTR
jgi:hypothetical protein